MDQPNKLMPRVVLNPEQPQERAWRFLSNIKRKGQDPVAAIADEQTLRDLRYTLEQSGAFRVPADSDKENVDDGLTEEQRLQKWICARNCNFKVRATAAPFVPTRPLLGHQMAAKARLRRTPVKRVSAGRLERVTCERERERTYEADVSQFIILKRPKRKSTEAEEARKGE